MGKRGKGKYLTANKTINHVIVTNPKDIKNTFYQLVQYTSPHGTEVEVYGKALIELGWTEFPWGYQFSQGTPNEQQTIFAAHLDDVSMDHAETQLFWTDAKQDTLINNSGDIVGADDKTGVAILLFLQANNVGGTYTLFFGEEVGCIGSREWVKTVKPGEYRHMVEFDRRGKTSIITFQSGTRTASEAFASALAAQINKHDVAKLKYSPDDSGLFTDSSVARSVIPECTNVSVGYEGAHSRNETQNMDFLEMLANALLGVDWVTLPSVRDVTKTEGKSYAGYTTAAGWKQGVASSTSSTSGKGGVGTGYYNRDGIWIPYTAHNASRPWDTHDDDLYTSRAGKAYDDFLDRRNLKNKKGDFIGTGKHLTEVTLLDVITAVARGRVTLAEFLGVSWRLDQEIAEFFFRTVLEDELFAEGIADKMFDYEDGIPGEDKPEKIETVDELLKNALSSGVREPTVEPDLKPIINKEEN